MFIITIDKFYHRIYNKFIQYDNSLKLFAAENAAKCETHGTKTAKDNGA